MATRAAKVTREGNGTVSVVWEQIEEADTAGAVFLPKAVQLSVQVIGTFDSATLAIQGSNDGTNFAALPTAVSLTAAGLKLIAGPFKYYKPVTSGGGATSDLDVFLTAIEQE